MSDMGCRRFQNTLNDLLDCFGHLDDADLSDEEEQARKELLELCREIAEGSHE